MRKQWKKIGAIFMMGMVVLGSVTEVQGQNIMNKKGKVEVTQVCTDSGIKSSTPSAIISGAGIEASPSPAVSSGGGIEVTTQPAITSGPVVQVTPTPTSSPEIKEEISMTWKKKVKKLKAGKSYKFQVKVKGATVSRVSWSVSNKKYAVISKKGVLTGKRKGTVTVKARCKKITVKCKVKIMPKQVIGIDPGHQRYGNSGVEPIGPGANTKKTKVAGGTSGVATGVAEYQLNLDIAQALKKELLSRGYDVVLTRNKHDVNITNKERAEKINKSGADICIRLHADGGPASAMGASGLYPSGSNPYVGKLSAKSKKLSECVLASYCAKTNIRNRGSIVRDDLTGTNWSTVPVIVLEMGFMTNAKEDRYMQSKEGQKQMVKGIADGIDVYYK